MAVTVVTGQTMIVIATAASVSVSRAGVTAGNGLVMFGVVQDVTKTLTPSITNSNTCTQAQGATDGEGFRGYIWYDHTATAGDTTFTITADSGTPALRVALVEVSGAANSASFDDARNVQSNAISATPAAAAVTTTSAGRAICYFCTTNGFTISSWNASWSIIGTADSRGALGEHATVASTTYTPGVTFGSSEITIWLCINVAEAGGGGGSTFVPQVIMVL